MAETDTGETKSSSVVLQQVCTDQLSIFPLTRLSLSAGEKKKAEV